MVENRVEAIMEKVTVDETVQGKCAGWKEDQNWILRNTSTWGLADEPKCRLKKKEKEKEGKKN